MTTASILWIVFFGSVGFVLFVYGKRQSAIVPLVCGLILMVYPYFISNVTVLVIVGVVLMAVPYFVRL